MTWLIFFFVSGTIENLASLMEHSIESHQVEKGK
jgi:hypothetical protein